MAETRIIPPGEKVCPFCHGSGKQPAHLSAGVGGPCMFCEGTGLDKVYVIEQQVAKERKPKPEAYGPPKPPQLDMDAAYARNSCTCSVCTKACLENIDIGWFLPGEAEKAAELRELSLQEFFNTFLVVDHNGGVRPTYVLAPARGFYATPGGMAPYDKEGKCIFLTESRHCGIYEARPFSCRAFEHGMDFREVNSRNEAIAHAWFPEKHQDQLRELAGGYLYEAEDPRDYDD